MAGSWLRYRFRKRELPAAQAQVAAPLELLDRTSQSFALSDCRGSVVLLSLWADWRAPCRREAPLLSRLPAELGARGLPIVGLNAYALSPAALEQIAREWRVGYRLASPSGRHAREYGGPGLVPHDWFIDRQGRVRGEKSGAIAAGPLRRALDSLLDEPSDAAP